MYNDDTLSLGLSSVATADLVFIESLGYFCQALCQDRNKFAVPSGIHRPTRKTFRSVRLNENVGM